MLRPYVKLAGARFGVKFLGSETRVQAALIRTKPYCAIRLIRNLLLAFRAA